MNMPRFNLIGKVYGRLTVVSHAFQDVSGSHWYCRCSCNNSIRKKSYRGRTLKDGKSTSCGCYQKEQSAKSRKSNNKALWHQKFIGYKNAAKHRAREFLLSLEEFKELCLKPCHYCKRLGVNETEFLTSIHLIAKNLADLK